MVGQRSSAPKEMPIHPPEQFAASVTIYSAAKCLRCLFGDTTWFAHNRRRPEIVWKRINKLSLFVKSCGCASCHWCRHEHDLICFFYVRF
jgi:hypothetical protein